MTLKETYDGAVQQFEADILSPIVPGELERWFDDLWTSVENVRAASEPYFASVCADEDAEIAEQDAEMFRRIDQLKEGDAKCQAELIRLIDRISELKRLAPRCEPDEMKMQNAVEALVEQGADWVICTKRQEMARETWLSEAFNRDRGPGD